MEAREKVSKSERLLNLISFMLRVRRPVPFSEIAGQVIGYDDEARLDSIEKRFDRDKAELRKMGIPVEYIDTGSTETSGYVIPPERFFLGKIELDASDAVILATAARNSAIAHSSPKMKEAFDSAMRKLSVDVPIIDDAPLESTSILQISSGHVKVGENLQAVCAALYSRRRISFVYTGARTENSGKRTVDPYGLGISRGEWYMVGHCHSRQAVRMFKLARIEGIVVASGPSDVVNEFEIPADFRISDHLHREAWEFGEGEPMSVRVELPSDLASHVCQRVTHATIDGAASTTGRSVVAFRVRGPERFLDWVSSLGAEARLLSPPDLVDRFVERLDSASRAYAGAEARRK